MPAWDFFTWEIPRRLALLAVFWLAAWALGEPAARRLKAEPRWFFGLVLGSGALGLLALALGLAGLLRSLPALLGVLAVAGGARGLPQPGLPREPLGWAVVGAFAFGAFLWSQAPVTFYDALVYHLSLPDLYLRRGAVEPVHTIVFSGLPAGQQMLYAWLLSVGDGPLCAALAWSQSLLVAAGLAVAAGRAGVWAGAVWLSSPMVILQASRPGTEAAGALYLVAALVALERPLVAGLCAGLALGSKYQGGVVWIAGAAVYAWRRDWRAFLTFSSAAAALFIPWALRAALHLPRAGDFAALAASGEPQGVAGLWRWPLHVWSASFPSESTVRDNALSAAYLAGAARPSLFGAAAFLPMAMATAILRYQIPALAALAVPVAQALLRMPLVLPPLLLLLLLRGFASLDGGAMWLPKDIYLSESRPGYPAPPYRAFRWMNAHLPKEAKVLLVQEDKSFYLERDRVPASLFLKEQPTDLAGVTHVFVNEADVNGVGSARRLDRRRLKELWREGPLVVYSVAGS